MILGTLRYTGVKPPKTYPKGRRCASCGGIVSIYTPPQPITGDPLCNHHWQLPEGYALSAAGQAIKEKT